MRYLSVCSGIEAATVAWEPLGWSAFAFSEIEPFPCKVLAHHYPDVPNFGDMTKFKEWPDANVDVLVGGTPCQSFSIAGLRKGLDDPRGNLMLTYLAIAAKYRPKWVVWENVPGVLSSNGGRDFASLLRGLAELGYGFAYRVLDAQYFGVPQRRRRVFVVGCLGDWRSAAAVLFDRESMSGNPAPSRKKGQEVTEVAGTLAANGGGTTRPAGNANELDFCIATSNQVANCLTTKSNMRNNGTDEDFVTYALAGNTIDRKPKNGGNGLGFSEDVGYTLTKTDVHAVAFNWQGSAQQGASVSENVTPTLDKSKVHAVATFDLAQITSKTNRSEVLLNKPSSTLLKDSQLYAIAFGVSEKPDVAHCLRSGASKADKHESTTYIVEPVAYSLDSLSSNSMKSSNPLSGCNEVDVCKTLDTSRGLDPSCNQGGIAVAFKIRGGCEGGGKGYLGSEDAAFTLSTNQDQHLFNQMRVRRLTPRECERLQGFPDDYTNIPNASDGPRYKALGNSMAVPVMRWIGQRIQMVHNLQAERKAA